MIAIEWARRARLLCGLTIALQACSGPTGWTGPSDLRSVRAAHTLLIEGQHRRLYRGLRVTTTSGDCVRILGSTDITIEQSQIGPCGGNGIVVSGGGVVRIYDSYIHPETRSKGCCDNNDGILMENTHDVTVQGDVVAYGESNVEAPQSTSSITILGNFLLNPRGPYPRGQNVQVWNGGNITVRDNYTLSSRDLKRYRYPDDQEDSINFGMGSGFVAQRNYVTGGHSRSGCGLLADDGANSVTFGANRLVNTGQCGIGVASGTNARIAGNRVLNKTPVRGGGNTAIYVWNQYPSEPCGPVEVSRNVATEVRGNGSESGFWNGGGCDPVSLHHNVWGEAARKRLTPVKQELPPPPIPPQPKRCAIESPYTNQTAYPPCG